MRPYRDANGSGITHFYAYPGGIRVKYAGGKQYDYTQQTCGSATIEAMTRLARAGSGLHGYITNHSPRHKGMK